MCNALHEIMPQFFSLGTEESHKNYVRTVFWPRFDRASPKYMSRTLLPHWSAGLEALLNHETLNLICLLKIGPT
jgi:hypothetical protein